MHLLGIKQSECTFNATENIRGYPEFIPLDKLCDPSSGFIVNDTCVIEARIFLSKSEAEQTWEFMDFKGLGEIEKAFVPLLEEVCSWHPSLVDCQRKRRRKYSELAFTTLGEVLHFLKTKKVKDMDDDECKHLQNLWEELETFGFDLSWLVAHYQYALDMKGYRKKVEHVKRMEEKVDALELELEVARRELVSLKEVVEEKHLDAKLGYGG